MSIENFEFDLSKQNGSYSIGDMKDSESILIISSARSPLLDKDVKTIRDPDLKMACIIDRFVLENCPHCKSVNICQSVNLSSCQHVNM